MKTFVRIAPLLAAMTMSGCSLGPSELLMILLIVVILFGASRLPELGKALGETLRNFRSASGQDEEQGAAPPPPAKKPPAQIEGAKIADVDEAERDAERQPAKRA